MRKLVRFVGSLIIARIAWLGVSSLVALVWALIVLSGGWFVISSNVFAILGIKHITVLPPHNVLVHHSLY